MRTLLTSLLIVLDLTLLACVLAVWIVGHFETRDVRRYRNLSFRQRVRVSIKRILVLLLSLIPKPPPVSQNKQRGGF